ncbi:MAG: hypothetical protein DCC71_09220 [Proteobacteria bacterium]|nr:MAG: hypothetical protein DCC71_09220 [Pseudomonadota bacterium]
MHPLQSLRFDLPCLAAAAAACLLLPPAARAQVALAEVLYDPAGSDDELEWIELVNEGETPVDLASWSLGWGGASWAGDRVALTGVIEPGQHFVVGGPRSAAENASPVLDLPLDFEADLQNSGATADGVALFDVPVAEVGAETLPVSVVVYGGENTSGLFDETGAVASVDVGDAPGGSSIERGDDGVWRVQAAPTPGAPPQPVPEPARFVLAAAATAALVGVRRAR